MKLHLTVAGDTTFEMEVLIGTIQTVAGTMHQCCRRLYKICKLQHAVVDDDGHMVIF